MLEPSVMLGLITCEQGGALLYVEDVEQRKMVEKRAKTMKKKGSNSSKLLLLILFQKVNLKFKFGLVLTCETIFYLFWGYIFVLWGDRNIPIAPKPKLCILGSIG